MTEAAISCSEYRCPVKSRPFSHTKYARRPYTYVKTVVEQTAYRRAISRAFAIAQKIFAQIPARQTPVILLHSAVIRRCVTIAPLQPICGISVRDIDITRFVGEKTDHRISEQTADLMFIPFVRVPDKSAHRRGGEHVRIGRAVPVRAAYFDAGCSPLPGTAQRFPGNILPSA